MSALQATEEVPHTVQHIPKDTVSHTMYRPLRSDPMKLPDSESGETWADGNTVESQL